MTRQEVREHVNAELLRRGHEKVQAISNKEACKLLGLMPDNVVGIGSANGGKMLKSWVEGRPIKYDQIGGFLRDEEQGPARVKPRPWQSKKVARAVVGRKWAEKKEFYGSDAWRALRYRVLAKNDGKCECCGRSKSAHGVVLHVDHIKPRSKFPHLELEETNLQVLCEDCNLGKSNKDATNWRVAHAA